MSVRPIAKIGEPVLKAPTRHVDRAEIQGENVQSIIRDMIDTMRDANGAGIAANQIFGKSAYLRDRSEGQSQVPLQTGDPPYGVNQSHGGAARGRSLRQL